MTGFSDLSLKTKILLALAGLAQENRQMQEHDEYLEDKFFKGADIIAWIERREKISSGKRRSLYRRLQQMRGSNTLKVKDEDGNFIGEVEILAFDDESYKLGKFTVETELSAKLLTELYKSRPMASAAISKQSENRVVKKIFDDYKDVKGYELAGEADVSAKIEDAVKGLYFVRDKNQLLTPTKRFSGDEKEFIFQLSKPPSKLSAAVKGQN